MKRLTSIAVLGGAIVLGGCQSEPAGRQRVLADRASPEKTPPRQVAGPARPVPELPQKSIRVAAHEEPGSTTAPAVVKRANPFEAAARKSLSGDRPRAAGVSQAVYAVASSSADPAESSIPMKMSLQEAIDSGLQHNPDLIALRQTETVSTAAMGVAKTYPFNPFVQFQATPYENAPSIDPTAGVKTYQYILVMETFELAGQQKHRGQNAEAMLNSVRWNIYQAELQNIAMTERLYFTALYQQGIRELAQSVAELNRQMLTIMQRRFEAGQATAADVAVVRLDSRATQQQADLAEANYQTALLDLKRQLNVHPTMALSLDGELTKCQWKSVLDGTFGAETLPAAFDGMDDRVSQLVACRPDVLAIRSNIDAARSNLRLAQANTVPSLQAGPYWQQDDFGVKYFGFRGQFDVPVVNSGRPLVRQRQAEMQQQQTTFEQLQVRAELEARAAVDRYERARGMIARARHEYSADLPAELHQIEELFKQGEVDVLRIFTARTSLIQTRRAWLDTLNELAQAAAMVTATTGLHPQSIVETAGSQEPVGG